MKEKAGMQKIEEIIVVEGRDDTAAIRQAVDAATIETHGFGIREETWSLIEKAYQTKGIIVFTDPDTAGDQIRRRILARFPQAKEAFLDQRQAEKDGDIGIENASPEDICAALQKVHRAKTGGDPVSDMAPSVSAGITAADPCSEYSAGGSSDQTACGESAAAVGTAKTYDMEARAGISDEAACGECFTADDLFRWGLDGMPGAAKRRREAGKRLGIGQATAKTFLQRLNRFGISRAEIEAALKKVEKD